ncbi:hypothetical protein CS542_09500 [Pedobacter sp. IW39]|nr:hypothetical protein CS542_09500 [Pedobacter sp. IW39]
MACSMKISILVKVENYTHISLTSEVMASDHSKMERNTSGASKWDYTPKSNLTALLFIVIYNMKPREINSCGI